MKPEKKALDLTEKEKHIYGLLKEVVPTELSNLKVLSNTSNKKWDKTIKGLTKHNLATVNKTNNGLFVELT